MQAYKQQQVEATVQPTTPHPGTPTLAVETHPFFRSHNEHFQCNNATIPSEASYLHRQRECASPSSNLRFERLNFLVVTFGYSCLEVLLLVRLLG